MALDLDYSAALLKAQMDAITSTVGNAALLRIYGGTKPAGPGTTTAETLLAELTCGSPFAGGATSAVPSVLTVTDPTTANAAASGTPTWWRIAAAGAAAGAAGFIDGTAGQSGTAGTDYEMIIGATTSGQPVNVTAFTLTSGT